MYLLASNLNKSLDTFFNTKSKHTHCYKKNVTSNVYCHIHNPSNIFIIKTKKC